MGLYPPEFVRELKQGGIRWFANVSTLAEARAAEEAGADVIVAQGMEAGGHRGCFDAAAAEVSQVGLFALLPAIVDAVKVPVVATGGIAEEQQWRSHHTEGSDAPGINSSTLSAGTQQHAMTFITGEPTGDQQSWVSAGPGPLLDHGIPATFAAGIHLDLGKDFTGGTGEIKPDRHGGSGSPALSDPKLAAGPTPNADDGQQHTAQGVFKPHA